jgi:hypothetical protein
VVVVRLFSTDRIGLLMVVVVMVLDGRAPRGLAHIASAFDEHLATQLLLSFFTFDCFLKAIDSFFFLGFFMLGHTFFGKGDKGFDNFGHCVGRLDSNQDTLDSLSR